MRPAWSSVPAPPGDNLLRTHLPGLELIGQVGGVGVAKGDAANDDAAVGQADMAPHKGCLGSDGGLRDGGDAMCLRSQQESLDEAPAIKQAVTAERAVARHDCDMWCAEQPEVRIGLALGC